MGIYFADVGLDKATAVATLLGAFFALAGLALTGWGVLAAKAATAATPEPAPGGRVTNIIANSTINGSVNQAERITPATPPNQ
jgi:hypothetical protein